jgi:hypothetical protein
VRRNTYALFPVGKRRAGLKGFLGWVSEEANVGGEGKEVGSANGTQRETHNFRYPIYAYTNTPPSKYL